MGASQQDIVSDLPACSDRLPWAISGEGTGRAPKRGEKVQLSYSVRSQNTAFVDVSDDTYEVGSAGTPFVSDGRVAPQLKASELDDLLQKLKPGQVATTSSSLRLLLAAGGTGPVSQCAGLVAAAEPDAEATAEVSLLHVCELQDCSFESSSGVIVKEIITPGVGAWYEKPLRGAAVKLRIEEAWSLSGPSAAGAAGPSGGIWVAPRVVEVELGVGELCDALESAVPQMKRKETAIIRCSDEGLCSQGEPQLDVAADASGARGGVAFRVTLIEFRGGIDDVCQLGESEVSEYLIGQKEAADLLLTSGRYHLASVIYKELLELCAHQQKRGLETARRLQTPCGLNQALCHLKLGDAAGVIQSTDRVLTRHPENIKAWYRRAQALEREGRFMEAAKALRRLQEIEPDNACARELLQKVRRQQRAEDAQQKENTPFGKWLGALRDYRSIKPNYLESDVGPLPTQPPKQEEPLRGKCGYDDW